MIHLYRIGSLIMGLGGVVHAVLGNLDLATYAMASAVLFHLWADREERRETRVVYSGVAASPEVIKAFMRRAAP